ncbi:cytochrome P450 [Nocardia mexicana]|uniref:cytochrome P450 n=1 Tax=Nocardia mexicana TaxID=279262 RepID=UPI0011C05AA6|nr:cytochrome P450 [Nocardia mexicana]
MTPNQLTFAERDDRYRRLHRWPEPTYAHSSGLRMVWRYDDVRELLEAADPGISHANSLRPLVGFGRIAANPRAVGHLCRHLIPLPAKATADSTDEAMHKQVWDTMAGPAGHFTVPAAERPQRLEDLTEHFHRALSPYRAMGGPLDVTALSIAYATRVIGEAVGLSPEDWPRVSEWSGAQSGLLGQRLRGRELACAVGALGRLFTVSADAVERGGADGFPARLRAADIPHRVAVSAVANSLAAGVHTVSGSIQQGVQRMLRDPGRYWWGLLTNRAEAARVTAKTLQLDPGLVAWKRAVVHPVTLRSGTTLPRGPVLVMFGAANRDPRAFADPLALHGPGKLPLTFGFGRHVCPGKQLAQLAIEVFLHELFEFTPSARLLPSTSPPRGRAIDLLFSGADVTLID